MTLQPLDLQLDADQLKAFFPLFQKGVTVPATVGCSLKSLLCEQFFIPSDYVTDRITTIFLDNRPVDDLDGTIIQNGARLTLSAAMPGLVGATMRRGGFYAALRQGISYAADSGVSSGRSGSIRLKLFNLLLAELAPHFLSRGLIVMRNELGEILQGINEQSHILPDNDDPVLLTVTFREQ